MRLNLKTRILLAIAIVVIVTIETVMLPVNFLAKNQSIDVARISVFDGTTGVGFEITDREDIEYIVDNVKGLKMKRTGISLGYTGYHMKVEFIDAQDRGLQTLIINDMTNARQDPFFYEVVPEEGQTDEDMLCIDLLEQLEEELK